MILCSDTIFSAAENFLLGHFQKKMLFSFSIQWEKYLSFFNLVLQEAYLSPFLLLYGANFISSLSLENCFTCFNLNLIE
jgi:hypothetical protein